MTDLRWMDRALCLDRREWTSQDVGELRQAACACRCCPVLDDCQRWASAFKWRGAAVAGTVRNDRLHS